jgi:hypothetical protein
MGCFCAGGLNLDGNHDHHMSGLLDDLSDLNLGDDLKADVSLCRNSYVMKSHRVDLLIDPPCYVSRGHHTNDLLDDRNLDDDLHDQNLVVNRVNRNYVRRDLQTDGNSDGNLYRHMNVMDDRNDLMMVVNLLNRNCVLLDLMKDGNLDVSHDLRRSDRLDDHRMNVTDDLSLDVSRANRNCVRRDRRMDVNLDGMSHRVMYY